ncbi:hypothetical protein DKX15_18560, partial [Enterococcus faecium]
RGTDRAAQRGRRRCRNTRCRDRGQGADAAGGRVAGTHRDQADAALGRVTLAGAGLRVGRRQAGPGFDAAAAHAALTREL